MPFLYYNWLIFPVNLQPTGVILMPCLYYNWLIFPVNLQRIQKTSAYSQYYNWLIFPVNLQLFFRHSYTPLSQSAPFGFEIPNRYSLLFQTIFVYDKSFILMNFALFQHTHFPQTNFQIIWVRCHSMSPLYIIIKAIK